MKDKNGFTLVELLVTIALIGTISIVVGVSINSLNKNQSHKSYDDFVKTMEDAGCVFAQHDNRTKEICYTYPNLCNIKNAELISSGLIRKTLENPLSKKTVEQDTTSYVKITYQNGERICKFIDNDCQDDYCLSKK